MSDKSSDLVQGTLNMLVLKTLALGPEHPDTLVSKHNFATLLYKQGHFREAEKLLREIVEAEPRVVGQSDTSTQQTQSLLAKVLIGEGNYQEAERIARQSFEVLFRTLGAQHPDTVSSLRTLGRALAYTHRYGEASSLFRETIQKQDESKGQGNPFEVWYAFATVAAAANRPNDALEYLREAVNRGYRDGDGMAMDEDLKILRHNPKFLQLAAELKQSYAKSQTAQ